MTSGKIKARQPEADYPLTKIKQSENLASLADQLYGNQIKYKETLTRIKYGVGEDYFYIVLGKSWLFATKQVIIWA